MDTWGMKALLVAIVEQAVVDWRACASSRAINSKGRKMKIDTHNIHNEHIKYGAATSLQTFFQRNGGLELIAEISGFGINAALVRARLADEFKGRIKIKRGHRRAAKQAISIQCGGLPALSGEIPTGGGDS